MTDKTPPVTVEPNQLYPEMLSLSALQPWDGANSSGRRYMFAGHLGQTLAIHKPTERRSQTGMERQYGKYTNNIKMPADGKVIKILDLYPRTVGINSVGESPMTLVVYEDDLTGEIGHVEITKYCYNYHYYGFAYKPMSGMQKLREGEYIAKDTIFMDSTSVTEDGSYRYGRETNVAFMSHPAVGEDGIMICSDVLADFAFRTYERRTISWGKDKFPINLYGDDKQYKPFPDIGDLVHPEGQHKGLLMALREYNEDLAVVEQNVTAVNYPDIIFDECIYANGPGGRVVDIRIFHDINSTSGGTDEEMSEQPNRYDRARRMFYTEILNLYRRLLRERSREEIRLTPEFHRWVVEAISIVGNGGLPDQNKDRVEMNYRKKPLDEWRVEFTIEYFELPDIGAKLTDSSGGQFSLIWQS